MGRLQDKVTIVTGAGSGIGRAIVVRFAAEGARVMALDVNGSEQKVATTAQGVVVPMHCDVSREADIVAVMAECRRRYGRLDVLCNNAGIGGARKRIHELSMLEWDRVIDVNVRGAFMVLKHCLPLMLESGGGAVVNTASIGSFRATPGSSAYITSKGAMMMLTQTAALEYVKDNIRVNAVCPGTIETSILDDATPETMAMLLSRIPQGRLGKPEEVAALALFLASDEASHITGQGYLIDGGRSAG
jgi:NAD(P)-dependent dehydrogenase (short-subunit alcohol dehydrogenase family)